MPTVTTRRLAAVAATAALALPLAACGGSDGSDGSGGKPDYCQQNQKLKDDIAAIGKVDVAREGLNALEAQLKQVRADAEALVASAKNDFPDQTSAISTSIDALQKSIQDLPSNPSAQTIASLGVQVSAVVTAIKDFDEATKDTC